MKCNLVKQGYEPGRCSTEIDGEKKRACEVTLKKENGELYRLIRSVHHSIPEYYLSIYQSGCNSSCKKCHSWGFTQYANGEWYSPEDILEKCKEYEIRVTVKEPKERTTSWHAHELEEVNPYRDIVAFTGGDLTCQPEFYAKCTELIKENTDLSVLIETNGYGLTEENLDKLDQVDSFWLDIKAWKEETHKELTGLSNQRILELPSLLKERGFTQEILTLYIPDLVEEDQIKSIAEKISKVDSEIPFTILAYFPAYKLKNRTPTTEEMKKALEEVEHMGLKNVRIGNKQVLDTHKLF